MMYGETFLCVAPRPWDSLWRESQQIMSRFARQNRVIYLEPGRDFERAYLPEFRRNLPNLFRFRARWEGENLVIVEGPPPVPALHRRLPGPLAQALAAPAEALDARVQRRHIRAVMRKFEIREPILWLNRLQGGLIGRLGEKLSCYHNYDEIADLARNEQARKAIQRLDDEVSAQADIVFSTSQAQCRRRRKLNPNTYFVPNGVDFESFNRALQQLPKPTDLVGLRKPIIGFAGWLSYYVDTPLLIRVAEQFPHCSLVLVGPDGLTGPAEREFLGSLPNVHFLGPKHRDELPNYLRHFDVALMPWRLEGHVLSAYPLKLHEYLAAGRSVVAVPLPELEPYRHVIRIASDRDDFVSQIGPALADNDPEAIAARAAVARQNTWEHRVEAMYRLMTEHLSGTDRAAGSGARAQERSNGSEGS